MYGYGYELRRERSRDERNANRQYLTEAGLWRNQHSGSYEPLETTEERIFEAIAEYERSNDWD